MQLVEEGKNEPTECSDFFGAKNIRSVSPRHTHLHKIEQWVVVVSLKVKHIIAQEKQGRNEGWHTGVYLCCKS